jgi:K+-sensing histidine kinase KdpD
VSNDSDERSRFLRTEFLERVAHELRGPAGVTLGALDELEHSLGAEVVEQNRTLFAMARRGVRRVLRTSDRLTRTAQLEGGTAHVTRLPADLRTLVRQAVQEAELIEGRSSVKVTLRLPEEPCASEVDGAWLAIALMELVAQAIRCARREVEVSLQARGNQLRLVVGDDRIAVMDMPAARFVVLQDRRDSALNWPLVNDVARAHGAALATETLRTGETVNGFRVSLDFTSVPAQQNASAAAQ